MRHHLFSRTRSLPLFQTTLATGLLRLLTARLKRARRLKTTLGGDVLLLVGVHAGEAAFVAGLATHLRDVLDLLLGAEVLLAADMVRRNAELTGWQSFQGCRSRPL